MTQLTPTPSRQERGRALAAQPGSVTPLNARCDTFHVKSSQEGRAPYTVRHLRYVARGTGAGWHCGCPDRDTVCKHIHAVRATLLSPLSLLTETGLLFAYALQFDQAGEFAIQYFGSRHGNHTLLVPEDYNAATPRFLLGGHGDELHIARWGKHFGERDHFTTTVILATLRMACGLGEASPEVEMVMLGVAS